MSRHKITWVELMNNDKIMLKKRRVLKMVPIVAVKKKRLLDYMCRCDFVMCVDKIFECLVVINVWLVSWFSLLLQQNSLHSTSIEIMLITIYLSSLSLIVALHLLLIALL